eukprot:CAMPEP_0171744818 /NCGR_PEP_ID=MMETSP0991-20121206/37748_1 /TAXON_ID=483369 /ORGANISM="non described non described, Strain CCMP2098" /LENGTH=217 /DNA_ID=CAMNT_0012344085 /DNA_START=201 /DNA_END=855 /DNA_ORIENTATION=+
MAVEFGGEANQGFVKVDETQGAVSGHQLFGGPGEARLEEDLVHVRRGHQVVIPPEDSALFQHSVEAAQRELSERGPASKSRHLVLFVHGLQALVVGVEHPVHMLVVQDNFPKLIPHELFARLFAALEAAQNVTQKMQVSGTELGSSAGAAVLAGVVAAAPFAFFAAVFAAVFAEVTAEIAAVFVGATTDAVAAAGKFGKTGVSLPLPLPPSLLSFLF